MSRTYNIVDADGHVLEPPNFWADYLDPKYRTQAPELFVDTDGKERLRLEGKVYGGTYGLGLAGAAKARTGEESANIKYAEGRYRSPCPQPGHGPRRHRCHIPVSFPRPALRWCARSGIRRRDVPRVQPLVGRLLQAVS